MSVEIVWTCDSDSKLHYHEHAYRIVTGSAGLPHGWGVDAHGRLLCPTCWGLR